MRSRGGEERWRFTVRHGGEPKVAPSTGLIYVEDTAARFDPAIFSIVLVIADDVNNAELAASWLESQGLPLGSRALRLLAPTLPVDAPPLSLVAPQLVARDFDACIDTSMVRSPFWQGASTGTEERRIADVATAVAVLVGGTVDDEGLTIAITSRAAPVLAVEFSREMPTEASLAKKRFGSEALGMLRGRARSSLVLPVESDPPKLGDHSWVVLSVCSADEDHPADFVSEVVGATLLDQGKRFVPVAVPDWLADRLKHPSHCAAFAPTRSVSNEGLLVSTETPTLELVGAAADGGWRLARYDDRPAIRRALLEGSETFLPNEIALPALEIQTENLGLVTRAPAGRDRIMLDDELAARVQALDKALGALLRRQKPPPGSAALPRQWALPAADVQEWLSHPQTNDELLLLLQKLAPWKLPRKRTPSVATLWAPRHLTAPRYAISERVRPLLIEPVTPDEAPAPSTFVVHGDESVPALFSSSVFAIWAQVTSTRSLGHDAGRMSRTSTFETFPIADAFKVRRVRGAPPFLESANEHVHRQLLEAAQSEPPEVKRARAYWPASKVRPSRSDTWILNFYNLDADARDDEVLGRLLALNESGVYAAALDQAMIKRGILTEPGALRDPWAVQCLHSVTDGVIGRVSRLLEIALEIALRRGATRIERYDLALAVDDWGTFLEKKLPLLEQYLSSNRDGWEWRVFGVSAQGGEYDGSKPDAPPSKEAEQLRELDLPSKRIVVVDGKVESHDLTGPLEWLIQ